MEGQKRGLKGRGWKEGSSKPKPLTHRYATAVNTKLHDAGARHRGVVLDKYGLDFPPAIAIHDGKYRRDGCASGRASWRLLRTVLYCTVYIRIRLESNQRSPTEVSEILGSDHRDVCIVGNSVMCVIF